MTQDSERETIHVIHEETIQDKNIEFFQKHFPGVLEKDPENGGWIVNTNKLQSAIDPRNVKLEEDGYELHWVGKKEAYYQAYTRHQKLLKPLVADSKNFDETDNVLIKGDNLDALKILRSNYFEQIKMIYIDPPYNTKSEEFIYDDNFSQSKEEVLRSLDYDEDHIEYIKNIQSAKTHSGWLTFMYPRLLLAKDLLKDDGMIFVSIDDAEVAQLKIMMDEVFGQSNFIGQLKWERKKQPSFLSGHVISVMEYVLIYAKNKENAKKLSIEKINEDTKPIINASNKISERKFPAGTRFNGSESIIEAGEYTIKTMKLEYLDDVKIIDGKTANSFKVKANFRTTQENIDKYADMGLIFINKSKAIRRTVSEEEKGKDKAILDMLKDWGTNNDGSKELRELLGDSIFSNPKPTSLIKNMILSLTSDDDIIIDFFAGSGTTAQAVMTLNAEEKAQRKFILVQWAEEISISTEKEKKENKPAIDFLDSIGKPHNIFEICAERVHRAGDSIKKDFADSKDLDIGFRVFEIIDDDKNQIYNKSMSELGQGDLKVFEKHPTDIILYSFMAVDGIALNEKITTMIDEKLYIVSNNAYIFDTISKDDLQNIKTNHPEIEYLTLYSHSISQQKFTLELKDLAMQVGFEASKIRIRM